MANYVDGINPEILRWAREKSGFTISQIASSLKKQPSVISEWENGESVPTYNQLEKLAYSLYKRPLALFFFPSPPEEPNTSEEFRTLPDFEISNLSPDTIYAIRKGKAYQESLYELSNGVNPAKRKIFKDIQIDSNDPFDIVSEKIRKYLGVTLEDQSKFSDTTFALKKWREKIEEAGIFIFKRSFTQREISGFCLNDDVFPLIYLNNSTAKSRQIFSIFHELAHILLDSSGVTKSDITYISSLSGNNKRIEVFCNSFAGEFLVPNYDFFNRFDPNQDIDKSVSELSNFYNASREVILRKLLDHNYVSEEIYEEKSKEWIKEYQEYRNSRTGGNYYANQATYLGDQYMQLAFSRYYEGSLSLQSLADHLNIKAKSVDGLEQQMLRRTSTP
jgi:Zn-dependent peptidase ImmA (M78 family)